MGLPIHDQASSVMNLARMMRAGLDLSQDMTSVRTQTLKLLLDTLIRDITPPQHQQRQQTAQRTIAQMIAPELRTTRDADGV